MQHNREGTSGAAHEAATAMEGSCLGVRVGRLSRLVGRRFDAALRPLGLSVSQLEVLSALELAAHPVRPADLASGLAIERSTMSRNLALMERNGHVETTETSPTGRSLRVGITEQGRRALVDARSAWEGVQEELVADLGSRAVPTLDRWIGDLTR